MLTQECDEYMALSYYGSREAYFYTSIVNLTLAEAQFKIIHSSEEIPLFSLYLFANK